MNFKFYQDIKVTIWQRQNFTIEAETAEEARKIAQQYANKDVGNALDLDVDIDWLTETERSITPEDNNGDPTIEVYEEGISWPDKKIADNVHGAIHQ